MVDRDPDQILHRFETYYAPRLIQNQLGEDGEHMARDFRLTQFHRHKYQGLVWDNRDVLEGSHVLEVGSNYGHWALLYHLTGAKSVTCLEPRSFQVEGLNSFASAEGLPLRAVQGTHQDCFDLGQDFDVVMLCEIVPYIPDVWDFFRRLRTVADRVVLAHNVSLEGQPADSCTYRRRFNSFHRAPVDLRDRDYLLTQDGRQADVTEYNRHSGTKGECLSWFYGIDFMTGLLEHLGYRITRVTRPDMHRLYGGTLNRSNPTVYHDLVLETQR